MNVTLCDDHFTNLINNTPCKVCPSRAFNRDAVKRVNFAVTPEEYKALIDTIGNFKRELKDDIKDTRSEFLNKLDSMDIKEDKRVKDIYNHIDTKVDKAFAELKLELDKKADQATVATLAADLKDNTNLTNQVDKANTRVTTVLGLAGSGSTIILGALIAYLFSQLPK